MTENCGAVANVIDRFSANLVADASVVTHLVAVRAICSKCPFNTTQRGVGTNQDEAEANARQRVIAEKKKAHCIFSPPKINIPISRNQLTLF